MPTEGTDVKSPITLGETKMAQVTYRGVSYDTEEYNNKVLAEALKRQRHDLMYRGVKVQRKMVGA